MWNMDTCRNVPVTIGMSWDGKVLIDMVLPFGLRSVPKIFSPLVDALEWILIKKGVSVVINSLS